MGRVAERMIPNSSECQRNVWSWREESNLQPAVYKTAALPIELRQPTVDPLLIGYTLPGHSSNRRKILSRKALFRKAASPVRVWLALTVAYHYPVRHAACSF